MARDSPVPGVSIPTSVEVASPRGDPLLIAVSGVPSSGTGSIRAQSIPGPSPRGPLPTPVGGMGGVICSSSPMVPWGPRPTPVFLPHLQQALGRLSCRGSLCYCRVCPPARLAVPRDTIPAISGWDQAGQAGPQVPTRRRLLDNHPAFTLLLSASAPQPDRVAPDSRDYSRQPSISCPLSVPGGGASSECGMDVEDRDRPSDPLVPPAQPTPLRAPLPLPEDPFVGH
jgi:hypothetical protein